VSQSVAEAARRSEADPLRQKRHMISRHGLTVPPSAVVALLGTVGHAGHGLDFRAGRPWGGGVAVNDLLATRWCLSVIAGRPPPRTAPKR